MAAKSKSTSARTAPLPDDAKITLLTKENPKRPKSAGWKRFAKYKNGMTVEAALAAGIWREDLRWDLAHGFISIAAPKASPGFKRLKTNGSAEGIRQAVLADQKKALKEAAHG